MAADATDGVLEARLLEKAKTQLSSLDVRGLKEVVHEVATCAISDIVGIVEVLVDRSFKTGKWCSLIESSVTRYLQKDFDKVLALSADAYHFRRWDEVQASLGSLKKDLTQSCDAWEAHESRQVDAKADTVKLGMAVDDLRTRLEAGLKERSATHRAEDQAKEAFARIDSVRDRIEEVHNHHKINSSVQLSSMRGELEKIRQDGSHEPLKEEIRGMHRALEVVGIRCAEVAARSEKASADVERKFQEYDATTKAGVLASLRTSERELRRELSEHDARLDEAHAHVASVREELLRSATEGDAALGARLEQGLAALDARHAQHEAAAQRAVGVAELRGDVALVRKEMDAFREASMTAKADISTAPLQSLEADKTEFLRPLAEALHLAAGCGGKDADANSDALEVRLRIQQLLQSIIGDVSTKSAELDTSVELFGGPSTTSTVEPPTDGPAGQLGRSEAKQFFGGPALGAPKSTVAERELPSPTRTKGRSSRPRPFEASPPDTPRTLPQLRGFAEARSTTEGFSPLVSQRGLELRGGFHSGSRIGDRGDRSIPAAPVALPSVPGARPPPVDEARTWDLDLTDLRNSLARVRLADSDSYMTSSYLTDPHMPKAQQTGGHIPAH